MLGKFCAWVFEGRLHHAPGDFFVQASSSPAVAHLRQLPGTPAWLLLLSLMQVQRCPDVI